MRKFAVRILGVVLATCVSAAIAHASIYPPGPGNCCPDTLRDVAVIQNPAQFPTGYAVGDTMLGICGIVTGKDTISSGFGIYIQDNRVPQGNTPWTGTDVFFGSVNQGATIGVDGGHPDGLYLGDSVVVYGATAEFSGGTELDTYNHSVSSPSGPFLRLISRGNFVPLPHIDTVHNLQWLPTNPTAEQWEGLLVRITEKMRVVRAGSPLGSRLALVVSDAVCPNGSIGPCDSVLVDYGTLAGLFPPATGSFLNAVTGLYDQRSNGYRIQIRKGSDVLDSDPPTLVDAYCISNDSVRVVFDRPITSASATTLSNYSLQSAPFSTITSARTDGNSNVILGVTSALTTGQAEKLTVNNIVSASNNVAMTSPASRNFIWGVLTIAQIQGPSPDSLTGSASGCRDVANFLGADNGASTRLTFRAVCTAPHVGSLYYVGDASGGARSGMAVFAPGVPLVRGHKYLIASSLQEFPATGNGESEIVATVYQKDEGLVTEPPPTVQSIHVLSDTSCDATQTVNNGEDWEGVLVRATGKIVSGGGGTSDRAIQQNFRIAGPYPSCTDSILVDNNSGATNFSFVYDPTFGHVVQVTGVLNLSFGVWRIQPRDSTDIVELNTNAVDQQLPAKVTFSIYPNPARTQRVSFGLPRRSAVELSVFDVSGRRIRTLARGTFEPGTYNNVAWDGTDTNGNLVGAGLFFYRLTVDGETYRLSGVRLK